MGEEQIKIKSFRMFCVLIVVRPNFHIGCKNAFVPSSVLRAVGVKSGSPGGSHTRFGAFAGTFDATVVHFLLHSRM
jgi:hypothetical protein